MSTFSAHHIVLNADNVSKLGHGNTIIALETFSGWLKKQNTGVFQEDSFPLTLKIRRVSEGITKDAHDTLEKVCAAMRYAATFHDKVEELVEVEDFVSCKETDGRMRRKVRAVEGEENFSCKKCIITSLSN